MCFCKDSTPIVRLRVKDNDNYQHWQSLFVTTRAQFEYSLPVFKFKSRSWLKDKRMDVIPVKIKRILIHPKWEDFVSNTYGIKLFTFTAITFFFATNNAPVSLKRDFWRLLLLRPRFDANGCIGHTHPYFKLFKIIKDIDEVLLRATGAFHDVAYNTPSYHPTSKWEAYNVWGCRGVYEEARGGPRRLVNTNVTIMNNAFEPIDWNKTGILTVETRAKYSLDLFPFMDRFDEAGRPFRVDSD